MKGPKGLTDEFYGFIKSKKRSIFVIDSYFKRQCIYSSSKGCKVLNKLCERGGGYHLSIEGIRKGFLFREKWYIKG